MRYNIALLEMKTPFVFDSYVLPICVPNENIAQYNFESCYITGYNAQPGGEFLTLDCLLEMLSFSFLIISFDIFQMMLECFKKLKCG